MIRRSSPRSGPSRRATETPGPGPPEECSAQTLRFTGTRTGSLSAHATCHPRTRIRSTALPSPEDTAARAEARDRRLHESAVRTRAHASVCSLVGSRWVTCRGLTAHSTSTDVSPCELSSSLPAPGLAEQSARDTRALRPPTRAAVHAAVASTALCASSASSHLSLISSSRTAFRSRRQCDARPSGFC